MKKLLAFFLVSVIGVGATIYLVRSFRSLEQEIVSLRGAQAVQSGYLNQIEIRLRDRDSSVDDQIDELREIVLLEQVRLNKLTRVHPLQAMYDNARQ